MPKIAALPTGTGDVGDGDVKFHKHGRGGGRGGRGGRAGRGGRGGKKVDPLKFKG